MRILSVIFGIVFVIGLTTSSIRAASLPAHSIYAPWVLIPFCEMIGLDDYQECSAQLSLCYENKGSIRCPQLGVCSYHSKGREVSRSYCFISESSNGKQWFGSVRWENGNKLELLENGPHLYMNKVRVTEKKSKGISCYNTKGNKERFCFTPKQDYRFAGSPFARVWITRGTTCTNRLYPITGGVAIIEQGFRDKKPSLKLSTDDLTNFELMGIEGQFCEFFNLTKQGPNALVGEYECKGEYLEGASPETGVVALHLKNDALELEIVKAGKQERYYQCQG